MIVSALKQGLIAHALVRAYGKFMRPFVAYAALVLAIMFLAGALIAGVEILLEENVFANPKLKSALGFFATGGMFLGIGLRGWRARRRTVASHNRPK